MNFYKLYSSPSKLIGYKQAYDIVPELVWEIAEARKKLNSTQIQTLAKSPYYAYRYASHVIKGRWPEGEKAIASNATYAYNYARYVIKDRWPEGEKASIASDAEYAYYYARYVIKDRWPEGEKASIASNAYYAYFYAKYIINGPWLEGEAAIATDDYCSKEYKKFLKNFFKKKEK